MSEPRSPEGRAKGTARRGPGSAAKARFCQDTPEPRDFRKGEYTHRCIRISLYIHQYISISIYTNFIAYIIYARSIIRRSLLIFRSQFRWRNAYIIPVFSGLILTLILILDTKILLEAVPQWSGL